MNGNTLIHAISSWWVTLHGHSEPSIAVVGIAKQARTLEQVIFAGFSHAPAAQLAEAWVKVVCLGSCSGRFFPTTEAPQWKWRSKWRFNTSS